MRRKNHFKRIFIYILVGLLAFPTVPMSVWADDEDAQDKMSQETDDVELPVLSSGLDFKEACEFSVDEDPNSSIDMDGVDTYGVETFSYAASNEEVEYWESFSSEYYYNQLENDYERAFWKELESVCDTVLYSDGGVSYVSYSNGTGNYATAGASFKKMDSESSTDHFNRAKEIIKLFYGSNPQYYFIENGYIYSSNYITYRFMIYNDFSNAAARKTATAEFKNAINNFVKQIDVGDELSTIKEIHDSICGITVYNYDAADDLVDEEDSKSQSAYSCLVMNSTVCSGYAHSTQLFCNYFGIDSAMIFSNGHAWNLVKCEDNWYQIDTTWADQDERGIYYAYFMKSYTDYRSKASHISYSWMDKYLPPATLDSTIPYSWRGDGITIPDTNDAISGSYSMSGANGRYTISLYADNANADIYYALDGSAPDEAKVKCYKYKTPIVTESESAAKNIRFIVVCDKYYDSDILSTSDAETNMKISPYGYVGRSAADTIIFDMYFKMDSASYNNPDVSVKAQNSSGDIIEYKMSELSLASYNSSDKTYIVSVPLEVKPKEMTNICSAQFYMGKEPVSEIYEQRFAEYLKAILSQYSESSKEYKCAYKLAQLGDASQLYFTYNTDALASKYTGVKANNGSGSDLSMAKSLKTYHDSTFVDTSDMCDMVGVSLSLKDTIAVNYYILVEDGFKLSSFSAYNDDEFVVTKVSDNLIKVSVQNIPYTSIKKIYHHQLCYEEKVALIIDYSISDYVANVLSSSSANASLKTLCRALFSLTA